MSVATRDLDETIYTGTLAPWLPPDIIDVHCHVSLRENCGPIAPERLTKMWAIEAGVHQTWDELRETYRRMLPGQTVRTLAFGGVFREIDIDADNGYVLAGASEPGNHASALFVSRPEDPPSLIEQALRKGFLGLKPYPDLIPSGDQESSIFTYLPHEHLRVLNDAGGILMLHIPRAGRLGHPENIRETLMIAERYPNVRMILAHIGRAYCLPTAEKGLPAYADAESVLFDTSANVNADVFELALEIVGPGRLLFGSDLPVTKMRLMREHEGETYTNFTDGDYTWNTNRKPPEMEANYTFFLYEELKALIEALKRRGLGQEEMRMIMHDNALRLPGLGD